MQQRSSKVDQPLPQFDHTRGPDDAYNRGLIDYRVMHEGWRYDAWHNCYRDKCGHPIDFPAWTKVPKPCAKK